MGQIVALDSMVFIYFFEEDLRFINYIKPLFESIESGKIPAISSIISPLEVLSAPKFHEQPHKLDFFTKFFQQTPHLTIYLTDWEIALEAGRIRRENKSLRTPDSIQLATALVHNAEVFVTNDDRLKNLSFPNLKILPVSRL